MTKYKDIKPPQITQLKLKEIRYFWDSKEP